MPRYFVDNDPVDLGYATVWGVYDSQDADAEFPIRSFHTGFAHEDLLAALRECAKLNGGPTSLRLSDDLGGETVLSGEISQECACNDLRHPH